MGLFDSLFGSGTKNKTSGSNYSASSPVLSPYALDLYKQASAIGKTAGGYLGDKKAYNNLQAQSAADFGKATGAVGNILGTTADMSALQSRMNPFTEAVLDTGRQGIEDQFAKDQQSRNARFAGARGLGGSGRFLENSQADKDKLTAVSNLEAQTRSAAFQNAQNQFNAEQQRDISGATQLGALSNARQQGYWSNVGNMLSGANSLAGIGSAIPTGQISSGNQSGTSTGTQNSGIVQTGLGLGLAGYGLGQSFGWFRDGGRVGYADGGEVWGWGEEDDVSAIMPALIRAESAGNPNATSPKGARGLAQIMPETGREYARKLGIDNYTDDMLYDSEVSQRIGKEYLKDMYAKYGNNPTLALAAYNAGPGRVDQWIDAYGDPRDGSISTAEWAAKIPFKETRDYVGKLAPVSASALSVQQEEPQQSAVSGILAQLPKMGYSPEEIRALAKDLAPREVKKRGLFEDGDVVNPALAVASALLGSNGNFAQALGQGLGALTQARQANRSYDMQEEGARRQSVKAQLDTAAKLAGYDARAQTQGVIEGSKIDAQRGKTPEALTTFMGKLKLAGIDPASPQGQAMVADMLKRQPLVSIDQKGESKFSQEQGKAASDFVEGIRAEANTAAKSNQQLAQILQLSDLAAQGPTSGVELTAKQVFSTLGVDPTSVGLRDNASASEALQAVTNRMAVTAIPPGQGAISNEERKLFSSSLPNLSQTNAGRKFIAQTQMKLNERTQELSNYIDKLQENGDLSHQELRRLVNKKRDELSADPLFDQDEIKRLTNYKEGPAKGGDSPRETKAVSDVERQSVDNARAAIKANPAARDLIIKRLKDNGISTEGL